MSKHLINNNYPSKESPSPGYKIYEYEMQNAIYTVTATRISDFIQYSNEFEDYVPRRYRRKKSTVIIQNQGDNGPF
jgi:hypothetical protein